MALLTNLVSYWKLDESSGNAADSHGSNTLTNNNSAAYAAGKINNGVDIEKNSSQSLSITDAAQSGLDITGDISISFWYNPESQPFGWASNYGVLLSKYNANGASQKSWALFWLEEPNDTFKILFRISPDGSSEETFTSTNASWGLATGTWHHIAIVWKASTHTAYLYLNGSLIESGSTGSSTSIFNSTAPFGISIGNWVDATWRGSDGMFDEVGIWSRELTSTEVTELYGGGLGKAYPFSAIYNQAVDATIKNTLAIIKAVQKPISASIEYALTITKAVSKTLSAVIKGTASITKQVPRAINVAAKGVASTLQGIVTALEVSASVAGSATVETLRVFIKGVDAAISGVATVATKTTKLVEAAATIAGSATVDLLRAVIVSVSVAAHASATKSSMIIVETIAACRAYAIEVFFRTKYQSHDDAYTQKYPKADE